jgi:protein-export chaperone SecB
MPTMSAPLSIHDIRVLKIHFTIGRDQDNPSPEEEREEANIQFNFTAEDLGGKEDEISVRITQSATLNGSRDHPFSMMIEIGGIFSLDSMPDAEQFERVKYINCNAILFPYLREAVSDICKRGGMPPIFLPPLNFVKMYSNGVFKRKSDTPASK